MVRLEILMRHAMQLRSMVYARARGQTRALQMLPAVTGLAPMQEDARLVTSACAELPRQRAAFG